MTNISNVNKLKETVLQNKNDTPVKTEKNDSSAIFNENKETAKVDKEAIRAIVEGNDNVDSKDRKNYQGLTSGQIRSGELYKGDNVTYLNAKDYYWKCPNADSLKQSTTTGNCYLVAGVSALADTKAGQEILNNAVKRSSDGKYYDVKMAGLDANVRVSVDEINAALQDKNRTKGDVNIILLEVATKKAANYYLEKAKDANDGQSFTQFLRNHNVSKESEDYWKNHQTMQNCVDKYIKNVQKNDPETADKLRKLDLRTYPDYKGNVLEEGYGPDWIKLMVPEGSYGEFYAEDEGMEKPREAKDGLLTKYENGRKNSQKAPTLICDFKDNIPTNNPLHARFMDKANMKSGNTNKATYHTLVPANKKGMDTHVARQVYKNGIEKGHAYNITKVTKDSVYVVNPWNTEKVFEIPREEFLDYNKSLGYVEIDKNAANAINFVKQFMPQTNIY